MDIIVILFYCYCYCYLRRTPRRERFLESFWPLVPTEGVLAARAAANAADAAATARYSTAAAAEAADAGAEFPYPLMGDPGDQDGQVRACVPRRILCVLSV